MVESLKFKLKQKYRVEIESFQQQSSAFKGVIESQAMHLTSDLETRQLFGGALECSIPSRFLDIRLAVFQMNEKSF